MVGAHFWRLHIVQCKKAHWRRYFPHHDDHDNCLFDNLGMKFPLFPVWIFTPTYLITTEQSPPSPSEVDHRPILITLLPPSLGEGANGDHHQTGDYHHQRLVIIIIIIVNTIVITSSSSSPASLVEKWAKKDHFRLLMACSISLKRN